MIKDRYLLKNSFIRELQEKIKNIEILKDSQHQCLQDQNHQIFQMSKEMEQLKKEFNSE